MAKLGRRGGSGAAQVESRLAALRQDLEALQEDMRGLGEGVGEAAQARLTEALRVTEKLAAQMDDWTEENIGSLREQVREQPLAACLLSMSAGALIGALLLRR
jgi:predicted phage gp36 major capsid-like protein